MAADGSEPSQPSKPELRLDHMIAEVVVESLAGGNEKNIMYHGIMAGLRS